MTTVEEILEKISKDIKESREESKKQHEELSNKIDTYSAKVDKLEKRMEDKENESAMFFDQFDIMQGELNTIKQKELSLNLVISGLAERENETLTHLQQMVGQVMNLLQLPNIGEIKTIRRIGVKKMDKPRPILIEKLQKEQKVQIIAAKRKNKINASQILIDNTPNGDTSTNIYIDDHLTPYTARILKRCKALKSETNTKYVWTNNGIVYIRVNDNTPAKIIRNDLEVDIFKSSNIVGGRRKRPADIDIDSLYENDLLASKNKLVRTASLNSNYMEARAKFLQSNTGKKTQTSTTELRRGGRNRAANGTTNGNK